MLIALAVGTVLYLGWRSAERNTVELIALNAEIMVTTADRRLKEYLAPAREKSQYLAELIGSGVLDPDDTDQIRQYLEAAVATTPQLAGAVFLDRSLQAIDVDRTPGGIEIHVADWSGHPDAQAGLIEMERADGGFWGDFVYLEDLDDVVINYRVPIRRDGKFVAAVIATVSTRQLSDYLETIAGSTDVVPFILIGQEDVLTYAGSYYEHEQRTESAPSLKLAAVHDPVLREMWNESYRASIPGSPIEPPLEGHLLRLEEGAFLFVYQYVFDVGALPWIVGAYFRGESFAGYVERIRYVLVAGVAVLLLGVVSVFVVGRRIAKPVRLLATTANRVRESGPADAPDLPPSSLREIDEASGAFNEMVEGLRDRELMRETFGKYVPHSIADKILADRGVLAPQMRLTTTLFTDIVGFSTVSESMDPEALIGLLNEYFAVLIEPISRYGGVIHQFQGDAILATYNLPAADPEHAVHAVQAALDIQQALRDRRFGDGVALATRVGINTGTAVCGTVGSGGRLGFTVHGDDVNLAARIEQMNKELGTRILVAESTVRLAGDRFEFSRVGEVPVRGRTSGVVVYRVVGPHNADETIQT